MANAEDLNRLTSCSLVLLGHIFLSLGNTRESMNMVTPAMQLASKIPDIHVQLWASSILKGIYILIEYCWTYLYPYVFKSDIKHSSYHLYADLYRATGDRVREQEGSQMHNNFNQTLMKDQVLSNQLPEHSLIFWTDGPLPKVESLGTHPPSNTSAGASSNTSTGAIST